SDVFGGPVWRVAKCQTCSPKPHELVDAYLYLGPSDSLTTSAIPPETYQDEAYVKELKRRYSIAHGRELNPESFFLWVRAITNGLKAPAKINFPFIKRPYTKEEKENADHGEDCRTDNSGYDCAEALFRHLSGRSAIARLS